MTALARDSILDRVRDLALEVIRALVPLSRSDAIARLSDRLSDVNHDASLARTTRSLLVEATPHAFRASVVRLLDLNIDPNIDVSNSAALPLDLSVLPPLAVAALTHEESDMLTTIEKLVQLRGVPLFGGIALEHLRGLAALAVVESYGADTVVFSEGDQGDRLYLVLAGQIAIEKAASGATVTLDLLGPSSVFGEMSLFDGAPRSATARARNAVTLLTISSAAVARVGREEPRMYESFLRVLAVRLRAANLAVMGALNGAPRSSRG